MPKYSVELEPLSSKYYETVLVVRNLDNFKWEQRVVISISGGCWRPSWRELDKGWEVGDGMNHTESQEAYQIALKIMEVLESA